MYSLGVMLFEMLSGGRLPFAHAEDTEILLAHLNEAPPSIRELAPQVHPALEYMANRLLAKNPAARYPSAEAALDIIKSLQARHKYSQGHLKWLEPEGKPFVDRSAELEQLAAVWLETRQTGRPQLAVVKGKAGIGKSRLGVEFLGREVVDKGFVVIAGKGAETEVAYAPYAEILGTVLGKGLTKTSVTTEQINLLLDHVPGLARLLNISPESPAQAPAVPRRPTSTGLWQVLSNKVGETPPPAQPPDHWQLYGAVLTILVDLGPTVLFLEDANALDEASLALTRYLLRQEQLPLLLLATCRESDHTIAWLDSLTTDELVVVAVPPLPGEAIQAYLAQTMGGKISTAVVNAVQERSQGHPAHLEEVVAQLVAAKEIYQEGGEWRYTPKKLAAPSDAFLPKAVFDAFSRQLDSLSDEHRQALALATLLEEGPEFDYDLWVTVLGGEAKRSLAENVLVEAGKKRLVRQVAEQRYAFRSVDIDKALAHTFTDVTRREQHRRIAELLRQWPAAPTLVSYHYEQAGLPHEATHYLEAAGAQAVAAHAVSLAIDCYQRLALLTQASPVYQTLGQLYDQASQPVESAQAFRQALALAEQKGDIANQARSLNGLAATGWRYDQYKEAYQYATAVLKM
ncbi:MAG: AAA family ATPase, partial [Anaerolineae bacterium]